MVADGYDLIEKLSGSYAVAPVAAVIWPVPAPVVGTFPLLVHVPVSAPVADMRLVCLVPVISCS